MSRTISPLESVSVDESAPHRCAFLNRQGNRCRIMLPGDAGEFCASHARSIELRKQAEAQKIATELLDHCDHLQTLQGIHNALANLYRLFAAKKIARADAFLLAYINRSLVRTGLILDARKSPKDEGKVNILWRDWSAPHPELFSSPYPHSGSRTAEHAASECSAGSDHHDSPTAPPPAPVQLQPPAPPLPPPPPPPPPFPSKPQTEFPLDEHPWGISAARPARRHWGPKYRGF